MFIYVLQELLKTPDINRVNFIQITSPGTAPLTDALGGALGSADPRIVSRQFTPADMDPEKAKEKPIHFEANLLGINYEVWGKVPMPLMPAPGALNITLQRMRSGKPVPILLMWHEFNIDTFEYHAVSQGLPLCEETPNKLMN